MSSLNVKSGEHLKIFMLLDSPVGAYHHYCAQLCNALSDLPYIAKVVMVFIFAEPNMDSISEEELELLDPRVSTSLLCPGVRSKAYRYFSLFKNLFRHMIEVSRSSPCVVHIQTGTGLQILDVLLPFFYRAIGIPIVRTVHEMTAAERVKIPNRLEEWLGILQLKQANAVITHDLKTQIRVANKIRENTPTVVVPHGNYLVFRKFLYGGKDPEMPSNNPPIALFLGIKRHKGIIIFLEALLQLQEMDFPIMAKIVGRINPGDEDIVEMIKKIRNVEINPGYIPNAELWRVYANSDFVVLPYLKGTTSGAIHLAYAFKRPVIASDIECFNDLVVHGKTGFIVPKGDPSALAGAMKRICLSREERYRMGEAGFNLECLSTYDWKFISGKTVHIYRDVIRSMK